MKITERILRYTAAGAFTAGALLTALMLCGCEEADNVSESGTAAELSSEAEATTAAGTETETETSALTTVTTTQTTTAPPTTTQSPTEPADDGTLVLITDYIPDIHIDLRYATENNFTGTVIYDSSDAYLCYGTVKKLAKVQEALREKGLSLVIWDAYRPPEAQQKLWEVCPDPTFVADPRNGITSHNRGNTIDISMVTSDGIYVELPSAFDDFSPKADRDYSDVSQTAAENSRMLESLMYANGFTGYRNEWWDYSDTTVYQWHF